MEGEVFTIASIDEKITLKRDSYHTFRNDLKEDLTLLYFCDGCDFWMGYTR